MQFLRVETFTQQLTLYLSDDELGTLRWASWEFSPLTQKQWPF